MAGGWVQQIQDLIPLKEMLALLNPEAEGAWQRRELMESALSTVEASFPGLSPDTIRAGRIPVATRLLEQQIQAWVGPQDGLKRLTLQSEPWHFNLGLELDKLGVQTQIPLPFECTDFSFHKERREASFRFLCKQAGAHGMNHFGRMVGNLPALILFEALRGLGFALELNAASAGMAALEWPNLRVDLDRCAELKPVLEFKRLGVGLLDLFQFGPLEIDQDRVWVRIKPTFQSG